MSKIAERTRCKQSVNEAQFFRKMQEIFILPINSHQTNTNRLIPSISGGRNTNKSNILLLEVLILIRAVRRYFHTSFPRADHLHRARDNASTSSPEQSGTQEICSFSGAGRTNTGAFYWRFLRVIRCVGSFPSRDKQPQVSS